MLKRIVLLIVAAALSFSTVAQNIEGVNARLDGMAGSGVADDIGWTVGNPRSLVDWPDLIQGSAIVKDIMGKGQTFGRIIAIKSIGDKICLGLTANNNKVLRTGFYGDAAAFLKASGEFEIGNPAENFQTLPHINVGVKILDNLNLGAGFFLERSAFEKSNNDPANNITDSVNEKSIYMPGGIIDAKVKIGNVLTLVPQFKFGVPRIKGVTENKHASNLNKLEYSSEAGLYLKGGLMGWTDIGNTFLILGAWYTNETYQFKQENVLDPNAKDLIGYEYANHIIDWFIGCQPSFSDNLYLAPEYDGGVEITKQTATDTMIAQDSLCRDTTTYFWYHDFRFGVEKSIGNVWIFDELIPRAGLAYKIVKEKKVVTSSISKDIYEDTEVKITKTNLDDLAAKPEGLKVTAGLGLKKGRVTIDISADLLRWESTFITGPSAAMASITIDISKRGSGVSSSVPAPAPVSEFEAIPEVEESLPESELEF